MVWTLPFDSCGYGRGLLMERAVYNSKPSIYAFNETIENSTRKRTRVFTIRSLPAPNASRLWMTGRPGAHSVLTKGIFGSLADCFGERGVCVDDGGDLACGYLEMASQGEFSDELDCAVTDKVGAKQYL